MCPVAHMKMVKHACTDIDYVFAEVFNLGAPRIRVKAAYVLGHAHMSTVACPP